MTSVAQLSLIKFWLVEHRGDHPIESYAWDAVLTLWLMGWSGIPAALLLWVPLGVIACVLLVWVPSVYVHWRRRWHDAGRLRCDWRAMLE